MSSKKAESVYKIDEEAGKVYRKGEQIGTIDEDGNVKLDPDHKKYAAPFARWVAQREEEAEAAAEAGEVEEDPAAKPLTPEEQAKQDLAGIQNEAADEALAAKNDWRDDVAFAEKSGGKVPPPPKKNPQFGDKTPNYVEWLRKHRPEKYREKYGFKRRGEVHVIETNADGIDEIVGYRETDITRRKVHTSEKETEDRVEFEDMSWDA